ncbi:hypothetical protein C8T65DRAFT_739737 [Cerioporus squamosus]|nr:hypothetical protein C8T65DRAFT_739737 [Cerioporus squamosus]
MESDTAGEATAAALARLAIKNLRFKRRTVQPEASTSSVGARADTINVSEVGRPPSPITSPGIIPSPTRRDPPHPSPPASSPPPLPPHSPPDLQASVVRPRVLPVSGMPSAPAVLRVNRYTRVPVVCQAHEAKVASQGLFDRMVITSPNMDYVPPYPVESMVIETYADGLWGPHEYSRTPQRLTPGMWHIACIPNAPSPPEVPDVLWVNLSATVDWKEDRTIGFNGLGYIVEPVREHLVGAATHAIRRFEEMSAEENVRKYGQMLLLILRQVVDRMRHLPATSTVSIAVAAHVQRICLELAGLKTYVEFVAPRMSASADYSREILPVLGTFVAEGSDAMNTTRVGLPTWFLQPLTANIPVWAVHAQTLVGVGNLTGNWKESMLLTVSKHVAGTHLASLSSAEVPIVPEAEPAPKRVRVSEDSHSASHLRMPAAAPVPAPSGAKRTHRSRHRGQGRGAAGSRPHPGVEIRPMDPPALTVDPPHPSKSFVPSPFYDIVGCWESALRAAGTVPRSASSALYFYPPPFLLDTVSSVATLPPDSLHPERARSDEKTHRYLHNLVRIRRFLRARMFDPSLSHEPLSIGEWRAALWGDYAMKTFLPTNSRSPSDFRRAHRRQGERNGVSRLFSRVAQLRSYRADESVPWGDDTLDLGQVAAHSSLRRRLLWESHEINFRAELMALDTLLVHKSSWLEIHRWEREGVVSAIWGLPSSTVTVIPVDEYEDDVFRWSNPAVPGVDGEAARRTLQSFARVLARWPDCPEVIVQAGNAERLDLLPLDRVQAQAVDFYINRGGENFRRQAPMSRHAGARRALMPYFTFVSPSHIPRCSSWRVVSMARGQRFYDALAWVDAEYDTKEVQDLIANRNSKSPYLDAAEFVEPKFKERFPHPYPGETAAEFEKRKKAAHSKRRENMVMWKAETEVEHKARMARLRTDLKNRFIELSNSRKKGQRTLPAPATIPAPKRHRELSGLDIFQGSEEAPDAEVILHDGKIRYNIGSQRRDSKAAWEAMSPSEREPYEELARQRNAERREESAVAIASDEEEDSPTVYTALEIAEWCKTNMKTMHRVFKWGGFIAVGGPDERGRARTFIHPVGENRHGQSMLQVIEKGTGVSDEEIRALAQLWVEQTKELIDADEDEVTRVAATQIIASLRDRNVSAAPSSSGASVPRPAVCPSVSHSAASGSATAVSVAPSTAESARSPFPSMGPSPTPHRPDARRAPLPPLDSLSSVHGLSGARSEDYAIPLSDEPNYYTPTTLNLEPPSTSESPAPSPPDLLFAMQNITFVEPADTGTDNVPEPAAINAQEPIPEQSAPASASGSLGESPASTQTAKRARGPSTSAGDANQTKRARPARGKDRVAGVPMAPPNLDVGLVLGREPRARVPSGRAILAKDCPRFVASSRVLPLPERPCDPTFDMPDHFEAAPEQQQMLLRVVLWTKNGELPVWRMVPFDNGHTVALRELHWLVAACDHFLLTPLEILENGMWRAHRLDIAELDLYDSSPTHLVRLVGVEDCPLLGFELEDIDRYLGIPPPPRETEVRDNREVFSLRHVRVSLWKKDGETPVHHIVSFNDDNKLQLAFHSPLDEDLYPWNRVDIWLAAEEEWATVSTLNTFELDARYDTLLVKLPCVTCLPGFGRWVSVFDGMKTRPEDFGETVYAVTEETASLIHEAIPAFYDIAMSTRASRDVLRTAAQRGGGFDGVPPIVLNYVAENLLEVHMGLTLRKRKRTGEMEEPPRLVRRRFAEV